MICLHLSFPPLTYMYIYIHCVGFPKIGYRNPYLLYSFKIIVSNVFIKIVEG